MKAVSKGNEFAADRVKALVAQQPGAAVVYGQVKLNASAEDVAKAVVEEVLAATTRVRAAGGQGAVNVFLAQLSGSLGVLHGLGGTRLSMAELSTVLADIAAAAVAAAHVPSGQQ